MTVKEIINEVATKYGASVIPAGGMKSVIQYPVLGQGSAISEDINREFDAIGLFDWRIKMHPSEQQLAVEVL